MNILIVSEKPSLSKVIAATARAYWPSDNITLVHAVPYGNLKFKYPRGLRMQDYPVISSPRDRLVSWSEWACAPLVLAADGTLQSSVMSEQHFVNADLIVSACAPDHTGAVAFDALMRIVFGDDRGLSCPALVLCSLDRVFVEKAFAHMQPFGSTFGQNLEYGLAKRYFDWNWNVNSFAVFGEALRTAGVPPGAPPLSKYSLQLLYAMRNERPKADGPLVSMMCNWTGTGRYSDRYGEHPPGLGSSASRVQILENLIQAGLLNHLTARSSEKLAISDRGRKLLELLHPDCEDLDLPFRLDAWCAKGNASKPAINRYIRTVFGKQLRFGANQHKHDS